MPFVSVQMAIELGVHDVPQSEPWLYMYDLMRESWIYLGRPQSPTTVLDINLDD